MMNTTYKIYQWVEDRIGVWELIFSVGADEHVVGGAFAYCCHAFEEQKTKKPDEKFRFTIEHTLDESGDKSPY